MVYLLVTMLLFLPTIPIIIILLATMNTVFFDTSPNPGDNEEALEEYNRLNPKMEDGVDNFQLNMPPVFPFKHPAILRVRKSVICSGMTQANKRCKKRIPGSSVSYCYQHTSVLPAPFVPESQAIAEEVYTQEQLRRCGYCFATEGTDVTSDLVSVFFCVGREVLLCTKHLDLIRADDIYTVKDAVNNV